MSGTLLINRLSRTTREGHVEELKFQAGVNVIVGPQNSGKSTWLRMLDYLMGETDSAARRFDEIIIEKYHTVSAEISVSGRLALVERQWNEDGSRSSMSLDGSRVSIAEFQDFVLEKLGIPSLRYPQGNVWSNDKTWPTLGWRSLLRHIYRRQDFWGELVPQQPESEQHACMLQFLGLAEHLFVRELPELIDKQRQITQLQSRKEMFVEAMHEFAPNLLTDDEPAAEISVRSVERAWDRVLTEMDSLVRTRDSVLRQVQENVPRAGGELAQHLEERTELLKQREPILSAIGKLETRLSELKNYRSDLLNELNRLDRADAAANVLADIRITHCPACDQPVDARHRAVGRCFLCHQPTEESFTSAEIAARRLSSNARRSQPNWAKRKNYSKRPKPKSRRSGLSWRPSIPT